jgi:DNA-binding transcriptional LysR family regulator
MVAAGIGSALIPRLAIDRSITGVVALDASRRVPARQIGLAWHRDATLPEAATDFVAAVQTRCAELAQGL